jgi:hypothetical protein
VGVGARVVVERGASDGGTRRRGHRQEVVIACACRLRLMVGESKGGSDCRLRLVGPPLGQWLLLIGDQLRLCCFKRRACDETAYNPVARTDAQSTGVALPFIFFFIRKVRKLLAEVM